MALLRHLIPPTYGPEAEEVTADQVVTRIFEAVEVP